MTFRAVSLGRVALAALFVVAAAGRVDAACTTVAPSIASLGTPISFDVRTTPQMGSTANAGLRCSGTVLGVLASGDHFYATITSQNGGLKGPHNDVIGFTVYGNNSTTYPIPLNQQFDYAATPLISLLGLLGGAPVTLPLYIRTATGSNLAAGTYTDRLTIHWSWDYCQGIGLFGICIGRDTGSGQVQVDVTITVTNACQVSSAPAIAFGPAPTVAAFPVINSNVAIVCTRDLSAYTVGVSNGQNPSGGRRRMASGANRMQYDIYKGATSTIWGSVGAARVSNTATGDGNTSELFPYRAQIYTDQSNPPVGTYTDSVVVDITF